VTDFRALCAELADSLEEWLSSNSIGGISLDDGTDAELVYRARAAIAQPEPQGPTDEEAVALYSEVMAFYECQTLGDMAGHFARAVLARYARPAIEPQGPTDEDLIELFNENDWNYISPETFLDIARSVLELR
jgi:hypothetical protein